MHNFNVSRETIMQHAQKQQDKLYNMNKNHVSHETVIMHKIIVYILCSMHKNIQSFCTKLLYIFMQHAQKYLVKYINKYVQIVECS